MHNPVPTKPGWYWALYSRIPSILPFVAYYDGGSCVRMDDGLLARADYFDFGPNPQPIEPPEYFNARIARPE